MSAPIHTARPRAILPRMSGITPTGALRIADPIAWKARVLRTLKECGGRVPEAAAELGVSGRTLFRWMLDLEAEGAEVPRALTGPRGPRHSGRSA
jgi:predicted ArsR family transcriptional regulator